MKLCKPSYEILAQQCGLEGIYRQIELAGRVSHKSEDKMTSDSAEKFVKRMIELGHGAVLEHGTVYLHYAVDNTEGASSLMRSMLSFFERNPYSRIRKTYVSGEPDSAGMGCKVLQTDYYITTNLRVLWDNNMWFLLSSEALCEPTEFHEKRATVRFVCDRGVTHELVRHKIFSFLQESTRRIAMAA